MTQTRLEQAASTSQTLIVALGLQATMQSTREQIAEAPPAERDQILATMMDTIATSMGALHGIAEA